LNSFLTISIAAATMTLGWMAQKLETSNWINQKYFVSKLRKDHRV